jgi:hypothetical protein
MNRNPFPPGTFTLSTGFVILLVVILHAIGQ